jgi:hypothetical protein
MNLQQCTEGHLEYERARADAAIARLRAARALLIAAYNKHVLGQEEGAPIAEALAAIGEIPE